jgi:hypothetical protein
MARLDRVISFNGAHGMRWPGLYIEPAMTIPAKVKLLKRVPLHA